MSCGTQCSRTAVAYGSETRMIGCQRVRCLRSFSSQKSMVSAICALICRACSPLPNTQTDAGGGEVMDLPRKLLAVRAADVDPLIVHEVAKALAHRHGHGLGRGSWSG